MKVGQVTRNVAEYMSGLGKREYSEYEASAIRCAIEIEFHNRKDEDRLKSVRSKIGKQKLNNRVADIVQSQYGFKNINAEDILLFKRARAEEYQDRTGRCAWGFKDLRKRLGYDPCTGLEVEQC